MTNPSIWTPGQAVSAESSNRVQTFIAALGQTNFTITNFTYETGTNSLEVDVSGVNQRPGIDFIETGSNSFSLTSPIEEIGTSVFVRGLVDVHGNPQVVSDASNVSYKTETVKTALDARLPELASYAALDAYSGDITAFYVRGVETIFDGGHGVFRRTTDTPAAANGIYRQDGAGRWWKREFSGDINVKWFGAVGNGVADDTASIQEAIDASELTKQALYIPAGRYNVTALTIKGRGRKIFGDGARASVLCGVGATNILTWGRPSVDVTGYCDSGSLSHIGIEGEASSTGGLIVPGTDKNATWSVSSRYNTFHDIFISGIGNGPAIYNAAWGNGYTNVTTFSNNRGVVFGNTSYSVTFTNCTFASCVNEAILIPNVTAEPIVFTGCVAQSGGESGSLISVQGGRGIEFNALYTEKLSVGATAVISVGANNTGFAVRGMRYSPVGSTVNNANIIDINGCRAAVIENISNLGDCNSVLRIQGYDVGLTYSGVRQRIGVAASGTIVQSVTSGSVFGNDTDSAEVRFNKRLAMPGFVTVPEEVQIQDDSVYEITLNAIGRGVILVSSTSASGGYAMVAYRTGDGSRYNQLMVGSAFAAVAAGPLTGTTGVDGNLTIGTDNSAKKLYIENRTGAQRTYNITLLNNNVGFPV